MASGKRRLEMKIYLLWKKIFNVGELDLICLVDAYKDKERAESVANEANKKENDSFVTFEVQEKDVIK